MKYVEDISALIGLSVMSAGAWLQFGMPLGLIVWGGGLLVLSLIVARKGYVSN